MTPQHDDGPLVTVGISSHNAGEFLRPSVMSIIDQTYANLEVFVVDDGSTDGSLDTISDLRDDRLHVLSQPNRGKAIALNRVLDACHGELFAIHDADDLSHPERVARQVRCLTENDDLGVCMTQNELIVREQHFAARYRPLSREESASRVAECRIPAIDPTAMFRVSMIGGGRFDPELRIGQGTDFILRVAEEHAILVLGDCLYSYRINLDSNTRHDPERTASYVELVRERALERRGLADGGAGETDRARRHTRHHEGHAFFNQVIEATIDQRLTGRRGAALRTAWTCSRLAPASLQAHKALAYAVMPLGVLKRKRPDRANDDPALLLPPRPRTA